LEEKSPLVPTKISKIGFVIGVVGIIAFLALMVYTCSVLAILTITHENIIQTHLPKIQQAVDAQCPAAVIEVKRDGFDYDPVLVWSTNQTQNGWRAECYWDQYDDADAQGNWYCTCLKPFDEALE
jgi:hypothetical protein